MRLTYLPTNLFINWLIDLSSLKLYYHTQYFPVSVLTKTQSPGGSVITMVLLRLPPLLYIITLLLLLLLLLLFFYLDKKKLFNFRISLFLSSWWDNRPDLWSLSGEYFSSWPEGNTTSQSNVPVQRAVWPGAQVNVRSLLITYIAIHRS